MRVLQHDLRQACVVYSLALITFNNHIGAERHLFKLRKNDLFGSLQ